MKRQQSGFTLIELIAVVVILGILAATAIPRFANLQSSARQAAVSGLAGALSSASALNYTVELTQRAVAGGAPIQTTGGCTGAVANSLLEAGSQITFSATGYAIAGGAAFSVVNGSDSAAVDPGDFVQCTLSDSTDVTATATFPLYWATTANP